MILGVKERGKMKYELMLLGVLCLFVIECDINTGWSDGSWDWSGGSKGGLTFKGSVTDASDGLAIPDAEVKLCSVYDNNEIRECGVSKTNPLGRYSINFDGEFGPVRTFLSAEKQNEYHYVQKEVTDFNTAEQVFNFELKKR
jgi:hypothetical protein